MFGGGKALVKREATLLFSGLNLSDLVESLHSLGGMQLNRPKYINLRNINYNLPFFAARITVANI